MTAPDEKERLQRENERLKKENEELRKKYDAIKKEYEEYKARHPETIGVKNGKPYVIVAPNVSPERMPPGARPGHKPAWRRMPVSVDLKVRVPVKTCPECGCTELSDVQETRK